MRVLLLALLALAAPAQTIDSAALDRAVEAARKTFSAPGIAVAIVRGDQVVFLKGAGVKKLGTSDAVTPDTRFALASTSKAFTTTAMAMLVDEGKLQWDDPVRLRLPGFQLADPLANELVTLRDLVSHRTGLSRNDALWYSTDWDRREILRRIGSVPLSKPFRSAYQYQNIMFLAAGEAVGHASGGTWEHFIGQRIFAPLGMTNSGFDAADAQKAADVATPHIMRNNVVKEAPWKNISSIGPAGSLNSSARDMSRWLRFQMAGGVWEGKRLVSEKQLRETQSPQMVIRDEAPWAELNPETTYSAYGLGWRLQDYRGRLLISHGGAIDGFRAQVGFLPAEKLGFVILTNLATTSVVESLRYALLDVLLGTAGRDWNALYSGVLKKQEQESARKRAELAAKRVPGTRPALPVNDYAGVYTNPGYGSARVRPQADGLLLEWGTLNLPLEHWHYETFQSPNDTTESANTQVVFRLGADGQVEGLRLMEQDFRRQTGKDSGK
jgi:CubicO group peptidase (beta-lactamase class C family)